MPTKVHYLENITIPKEFDSRKQWPNCPTIGEIRDQGSCGSCWAFGAVEVMSDRLCIATNGSVSVEISAEDLVSCCDDCGYGCHGGYPSIAFKYYQLNGLVSGGLYGTYDTCKPYSIPGCDHVGKGKLPSCKHLEPTPECTDTCQPAYTENSFKDDKHYGEQPYSILGLKNIQAEIMKHGPVEAVFKVHYDFFFYKSGVYQVHSDRFMGYHAVKILGWGDENGTPYWLIANSWNDGWGDKGYFKILRGNNECGIEGNTITSLPKLD